MNDYDIPTLDNLVDIIRMATIYDESHNKTDVVLFERSLSDSEREELSKQWSIPLITWVENGNSFTAQCPVKFLQDGRIISYGKYTCNGEETTLLEVKRSYKRILDSNPKIVSPIEDYLLWRI